MSESRDWGYGASESRGWGSSLESRDSFSSYSGVQRSRTIRDEMSTTDIGSSVRKYKQDIANQMKQLKNSLLGKKKSLQQELMETEEELKRLEQLERSLF